MYMVMLHIHDCLGFATNLLVEHAYLQLIVNKCKHFIKMLNGVGMRVPKSSNKMQYMQAKA